MDKINFKVLAVILGIALLLSLGTSYKLYQDLQTFKVNQAEFKEFQKNKETQQVQLKKLLEDNEKMLRDVTEIMNLEKKLRRAIIRDNETNKLNSNLSGNLSEASPVNSNYTAMGGSHGAMTGQAAMDALAAQDKNIKLMLTDTKKSVSELLGEMEGKSGTLAAFPNKWPTDGGVISSPYGGRTDPIASGSEWHEGIDIAADFGKPVYASGAGVVEVAGPNGGYGNYVLIDHQNGYKTAYGHMSGIATASGQKVAKGDIIGFIGSTGYSTGPHVHFEVIAEGQKVNPYFVLKH